MKNNIQESVASNQEFLDAVNKITESDVQKVMVAKDYPNDTKLVMEESQLPESPLNVLLQDNVELVAKHFKKRKLTEKKKRRQLNQANIYKSKGRLSRYYSKKTYKLVHNVNAKGLPNILVKSRKKPTTFVTISKSIKKERELSKIIEKYVKEMI